MLAASLAMDPIDLTIIIVYLVGIVAIGCLAGFRQRRTAEGQGYVARAGHNAIPEETALENILAMFDAFREYGVYEKR